MDQSLAESSREEDSAFSLNCSRSTKSSREAMFFGLKCCITSTTSDTVVPGTHSCLRTSAFIKNCLEIIAEKHEDIYKKLEQKQSNYITYHQESFKLGE